VADGFVEVLRKLKENEDVEVLVQIHTGDCEVGNVSVPEPSEAAKACASSGVATVAPSAR
jgi:hypothetical protein